jgi:two-component system chemotaxis response regulator CheY
MNLLIIDDSSVTRAMVIKTLKMAGLDIDEIHQASNGKEGLELLQAQDIDVVFTDINMPVMDGEEMIDQVRANPQWQDMPLVVVSTEGSETRVNRLKEKGARFVHKPFTPERVREVVEDLIQTASQAGEYDEILQEVAEETMMSLAFLFAMPDDETPEQPMGECVLAEVDFSGPFSGTVFLRLPRAILPELCANMLGMEPGDDIPAEQQRDAAGELLNVICGNLLPKIAGSEAVFKVEAPKLLDNTDIPANHKNHSPAGSCRLVMDTGECKVALFMDGAVLAATEFGCLQQEGTDVTF